MKSITCYNENNETIMLLVKPEEGDLIKKEVIERLLPYMKKACHIESLVNKLNVANIEDGVINFENIDNDELYNMVKSFQNNIPYSLLNDMLSFER